METAREQSIFPWTALVQVLGKRETRGEREEKL